VSLLLQIIGSVLILAAFAADQLGSTGKSSRSYLAANAVGSGALASSALLGSQWGFLALETIWCAVSVFSLGKAFSAARSGRGGSGPSAPAGPGADPGQARAGR
jgi:hypothetical protein